MDLYLLGGDRAAAIRQYRTCVAVLERELGVAPLASTTARYEAIRDADPPPRAPGTGSVPTQPIRPGQAGPAGDRTRPPLIGRGQAVTALLAARDAIGRDGRGRVVVVTGEAGIGKTRLGDAVADTALAGGDVVVAARGHSGEAAIPYGLIVELLRVAMRDVAASTALSSLSPVVRGELARLAPSLLEPGGPGRPGAPDATAHARLVGAIVDALGALGTTSRPAVLWIDDLHWVDAASLEVLTVLARRLDEWPLLLVLAWRDDEVSVGMRAEFDVLVRLAWVGIALERLGPADASVLIEALAPDLVAADRARISDAAEGLPLYLVEALAGTGAAAPAVIPPGVRSVLWTRLDPIDGTDAQVLAAAAIIGRTFDVPTVRHASGRSMDETVDALDRLSRRGIVREGPAGYDFAHGALRDLVDERIGLARRRLLHQRVAEALRLDLGNLGRDDLGRLTAIAIHEQAAGRAAAAAEAYEAAAARAAELFAHLSVIELAETALALGHPAAVHLHALIGRARTRRGEYALAVAAFEAAAARATAAELPGIEWEIARARSRHGDLGGADRHLATVLDGASDPRVLGRAWVDRSAIRRRTGDVPGAVEAARRGLAIAEDSADGATAGAARRMLGLCALDLGDAGAAIRELAEAVRVAGSDPDPTAHIAALVGLALARAAGGEVDVALDLCRQALEECRRIGDRHLEAAVEDHLADLFHAAGRDDEARDHQRRAAAAFAELGGDPTDPDPGIWMLAAW
jgi:tetratricopeptide (TPR) repeat protein